MALTKTKRWTSKRKAALLMAWTLRTACDEELRNAGVTEPELREWLQTCVGALQVTTRAPRKAPAPPKLTAAQLARRPWIKGKRQGRRIA